MSEDDVQKMSIPPRIDSCFHTIDPNGTSTNLVAVPMDHPTVDRCFDVIITDSHGSAGDKSIRFGLTDLRGDEHGDTRCLPSAETLTSGEASDCRCDRVGTGRRPASIPSPSSDQTEHRKPVDQRILLTVHRLRDDFLRMFTSIQAERRFSIGRFSGRISSSMRI